MEWMPLQSYLTQIILPDFLTYIDEYELLEEKVNTKVQDQIKAQNYNNAPNAFVFANTFRIRNNLNGKSYFTDIGLLTEGMIHQNFAVQTQMWSATFMLIQVPEHFEDEYQPLLQMMINSFKWNNAWKEAYARFAAWYNQQAIMAANSQRQVSIASSQSQFQRTLAETADIVNDGYWYRSNIQDQVFQNYHEYNFSVNAYADTYKNDLLEFDNTIQSVWTNGSGDYKVSQDPGYDPNPYVNESYYKLEIAE